MNIGSNPTFTCVASMEPRPFSRGDLLYTDQPRTMADMLQWSRDLSVAETLELDLAFWVVDWLQWSRDLSVAETSKRSADVVHVRKLQWSRDLSVAETAYSTRIPSTSCSMLSI